MNDQERDFFIRMIDEYLEHAAQSRAAGQLEEWEYGVRMAESWERTLEDAEHGKRMAVEQVDYPSFPDLAAAYISEPVRLEVAALVEQIIATGWTQPTLFGSAA